MMNAGKAAGKLLRLFRTRENAQPVELDMARLPRHIAVIMDGNGRWAAKRSLPRSAGHQAGAEAMRGVIRECDDLGIEALTFYAFSTENWSRPTDEVNALMSLLVQFLKQEVDELDRKNACMRFLGDIDGLPELQRRTVREAEARTGKNTGLKLNIALNYGGKQELLRAAKLLSRRALSGEDPETFTLADLEDALYTRGLPPVDLLIRTSGEMRTSNFLPYQTAYAEIVCCDTLWPDYDKQTLLRDIKAYQSRDRRFGKVKS